MISRAAERSGTLFTNFNLPPPIQMAASILSILFWHTMHNRPRLQYTANSLNHHYMSNRTCIVFSNQALWVDAKIFFVECHPNSLAGLCYFEAKMNKADGSVNLNR